MRKRISRAIWGIPVLAAGLASQNAHGTIVQTWAGLSSAGVSVSFEAHLTISGNNLTVDLYNTSPVASLNPNDILGSYYFDIVDGSNVRPTLTYVSAIGDVWLGKKNLPDTLSMAGADLLADSNGDFTWQFKNMDESMAPFLGFGIGTVGNSNVAPNNFSGNIVDGMDYGILKGDVTTANMDGKLFVKEAATFHFTGVAGFSEADIDLVGAFGMGTAPDSLEYSPEPASLALLGLGAGVMRSRRRR